MTEIGDYLESETVQLQTERLKEAGLALIVALNGPSYPDRPMTLDTRMRNQHAGALAIRTGFPVLFVGSKARENRDWTREYYEGLIIPERTGFDNSSRDSVGNAINAKEGADELGIRDLSLVTLKYHMPRASYCFGTVLGPDRRLFPSAPHGSAYSPAKTTYLRLAQIPIKVMNRLQLDGYNPDSPESLEELKDRLSGTQRYTGESKSISSKILRVLDKATSGKS